MFPICLAHYPAAVKARGQTHQEHRVDLQETTEGNLQNHAYFKILSARGLLPQLDLNITAIVAWTKIITAFLYCMLVFSDLVFNNIRPSYIITRGIAILCEQSMLNILCRGIPFISTCYF